MGLEGRYNPQITSDLLIEFYEQPFNSRSNKRTEALLGAKVPTKRVMSRVED